jgi:hypothetical protein
MRPFRVGDQYKSNHTGQFVTVTWVDPKDRFKAIVDLDEATMFGAQFLNHWSLVKEGCLGRDGEVP